MHKYSIGIYLKILSLILFTAYSLMLLSLSSAYSVYQMSFLRALVASILLITLMLIQKIDFTLTIKSFFLYILRAIFSCLGTVAWIYSLQNLGPNNATAIAYCTPIFATLLAVLLCREKLNMRCFFSIMVSMIGMYIIIKPKFHNNIMEISIALLSAFMWACYDIVSKKQTSQENYIKQAFYNFFFSALILLPFALNQWNEIVINESLALSILISAMSATTVMTMFLSYKYAPLVLLMPFQYSRLFFMAVGSYICFDQRLEENTVIGIIIISVSMLSVFYQQYKGAINPKSLLD